MFNLFCLDMRSRDIIKHVFTLKKGTFVNIYMATGNALDLKRSIYILLKSPYTQ